MTHEEIIKAARERIAEIDAAQVAMTAERAKLAALLAPASVTIVPSNSFPWMPSDVIYPRIDEQWVPPCGPWTIPLHYYIYHGESSSGVDLRVRSAADGTLSSTRIGDASGIHIPSGTLFRS